MASSRPQLKGKTPWEFACEWYDQEAMEWAVARVLPVPTDVRSPAFAAYLTHCMRDAMSRGIIIGQQAAKAAGGE